MRTYVVHGCWLAVAVIAFVFGSMRSQKKGGEELAIESDAVASDDSNSRGALSSLPGAVHSSGARMTRGDRPAFGAETLNALPEFAVERPPLSDIDIEDLGQVFKNDTNPVRRRLAFARLLEGLTADNAKFMREQIRHLSSESAEFREFHYAWGAVAGYEAVLHGAETRERDMATAMAGWASSDAQGAISWFKDLPEGKRYNRGDVQSGLVHGLASYDTTTASNFVYGRANDGDRSAEGLMGIVTGYVLKSNAPPEAADWATGLPPGPLRAAAMDRVAHDYVAKDPVAAAGWAEQFAGEPHNARVIEEVGDEWAERDPVASVAWLESLDAGDGKNQGMRSAFDEWAERDARAASEHLVRMDESPERDAAIVGFTGEIAGHDPEAAIAWAEQIGDARSRQSAMVRAGQAYLRRDANAARTWLQGSGLSAEAQQMVLNPPQRR